MWEANQMATLVSSERASCLAAIDRRFGWLKHELLLKGGNVARLKQHEQILWHGRTEVVNRFNRIGEIRDNDKRVRAYQKLTRELERRGR